MLYTLSGKILEYLMSTNVWFITGIMTVIAYLRYMIKNNVRDDTVITVILILLFTLMGIATHQLPQELINLSANITFIVISVVLFLIA